MAADHHGACLCGAVRVTVRGDLPDPDACHCGQCRKQTGVFLVSVDLDRDALTIEGEDYVGWFRSSEQARRGFCKTCGSTLFWDAGRERIAVSMGLFDQPTGTRIGVHIFVADKGDYYDIGGNGEQRATV
jgi:hypothetical protein